MHSAETVPWKLNKNNYQMSETGRQPSCGIHCPALHIAGCSSGDVSLQPAAIHMCHWRVSGAVEVDRLYGWRGVDSQPVGQWRPCVVCSVMVLVVITLAARRTRPSDKLTVQEVIEAGTLTDWPWQRSSIFVTERAYWTQDIIGSRPDLGQMDSSRRVTW